ncbi:MAG: hypothetical protein MJA30_19740 [Cytophagales bacterium]|nr:hypothetical protein [Cytophagales bacterium]
MIESQDNEYEKELKKLFLIAINDKSILIQLDEETRTEFRQLRYRMSKNEVGETTMRRVVEKYLGKRFLIVDR